MKLQLSKSFWQKLIIIGVVVILLVAAIIALILRAQQLSLELSQSQLSIKSMQDELSRVKLEKEKIVQDKENLAQDAISYLDLNSKLQEEKEKLEKSFEENKAAIKSKEQDVKKLNSMLSKVQTQLRENDKLHKDTLLKQQSEIQGKIKSLNSTLDKERALFHYNLGVAFSKASLYSEAIQAYEKSLEFDPQNPEAEYNLGLLYQNSEGDLTKALEHYKAYILLAPEADDKSEVMAWVNNLESKLR